jgi:hypothetical protein
VSKPRIVFARDEGVLCGWACLGFGVKGYGDSPLSAYARWWQEVIRRAANSPLGCRIEQHIMPPKPSLWRRILGRARSAG